MLEDAELGEIYVNDEGREAYHLTEDGVRVGNMLAMVEGEDADSEGCSAMPMPDGHPEAALRPVAGRRG